MKSILSSIQWVVFILAGSIVAPVAVGDAFQLPIEEIAGLLQRSFLIIGIGSLLQVFWGHELPIAEGPAGLWWGVFMVFAGFGTAMQMDTYEILQSLEMGLLISGCVFITMGGFGLINKIKIIFTPMVTGTYLFLLVSQLSGPFVKGILGVGYMTPHIDGKVFFSAFIILIFTALLSKSRYPMVRSFSILYGIIAGWLLFAVLGITKPITIEVRSIIDFPKLMIWGSPRFDGGIMLTSVITALLLLSNLIASIEVVKKQVDTQQMVNYNRAGLMMGINQILAGLFCTIGFVPVSTSAGFIATTRLKEKGPFIFGSTLILLISFFPVITLFFASLPPPVGYATIFLAFSNLIIMAFKEFTTVIGDSSRMQILAVSLMVGIGSMFVPSSALKYVPGFLVSIVNNGLILGVIICIILEQVLIKLERRKES